MQAMTLVSNSSMVQAFAYDTAQQVLAIRFRDSPYVHLHKQVEPEVAENFAAAESKGKAWHALVKGRYDVTAVRADVGDSVAAEEVASQ